MDFVIDVYSLTRRLKLQDDIIFRLICLIIERIHNCQNEELDYEGDYCNVCSAYLVNECDNKYGFNPFNNDEEVIERQSCGTKLSGNARYCHNCGNPSTFLSKKFLREWNYDPDDIPF